MDKILLQLVIIGAEKRQTKAIQPGGREWVTVIQAVSTAGWAIPPFIIFTGKYYLSIQYSEDIPRDWAIELSKNSWTTNELEVY